MNVKVGKIGRMVIPATTTPRRYISGITALNIPSAKGTGDWHQTETFLRPASRNPRLYLAGDGCEWDTSSFFGDRGIFECSTVLKLYGIPCPVVSVYAATHARAIADMVIVTILDGGTPDHIHLDDFMPRDSDKEEVFGVLDLAVDKLGSDEKQKVLEWKLENLS